MTLVKIKDLALEGVRVLRFQRHADKRGYFAETFRRTQFASAPLSGLIDGQFVQCNESYSRAGTIRGLHFQWDPPMGKLVRTLHGHMVDLVMDIRPGSPSLGRVLAYDMPEDQAFLEWIWVPPGFAHGNFFLKDTRIEYMCTAEYNAAGEAGISPLAADIDWSLCDGGLRGAFQEIAARTDLISEKDRNGMTLGAWLDNPNSRDFSSMGIHPSLV